LSVTEESTQTVGDVVYSTGTWTQTVATPDGKTVNAEGRYLVITQLQADGTWKITRHVSLLKPPAAPAS
jgi:ketosteroid isomerase-like protein